MKPLISVCIPVYNGEKYLRECLESVISQSYQHMEILIVDDCSSDSSLKMAEEFAKKDERIRVVRNDANAGLVGNWNRCIQLAKGDWIKFAFQDDFLKSNCVEVFVKAIEDSGGKIPLIVSGRNFLVEGEVSKEKRKYYDSKLPGPGLFRKSGDNKISARVICNEAIGHMCMNIIGEPTTLIFKKSITENTGVYNDSLEQICDFEFALRLAAANGFIYLPQKLTTFRIHDDSTTEKNISGKYYSLAFLEPVRLAHLFLYGSSYEGFRSKLTKFHGWKLKVYFHVKGYEAYREAKTNAACMRLFMQATEKFPGMKIFLNEKTQAKLFLSLIRIKRKLNS